MTNLAVLNNIDHKDLKITTTRSEAFGDAYMCVPTFPREFRAVQAHYPIVFGKNNGENYTPLVLLGLQKDENLFISEGQWDARYIPLCAEAKPFFIGPGREGQYDDGQRWVIHVDMDSPKLNTESGIALFKEFGGSSSYIDRTSDILTAVHEGITEVKPFTDLLVKYDLLESFAAETTLANGQKYRLDGFYTVNEERLAKLPIEVLEILHQRGFLFDIHMQLASIAHLSDLFERKNKTL
jgi:hypothetical protein